MIFGAMAKLAWHIPDLLNYLFVYSSPYSSLDFFLLLALSAGSSSRVLSLSANTFPRRLSRNSDLPYWPNFVLKATLWNIYWFSAGCVGMGLWVLAHECGHGAFSENKVSLLSSNERERPSVRQGLTSSLLFLSFPLLSDTTISSDGFFTPSGWFPTTRGGFRTEGITLLADTLLETRSSSLELGTSSSTPSSIPRRRIFSDSSTSTSFSSSA